MNPTISIITPSYNQGRFIERTIQSVLSQENENIEYVVFDGGSTDQTVEIIKKYGSRFRWVSKKDRGQTDAINKGLMATSGEIVAWLNSDDVYYPGAINEVCRFFKDHPEIDLLYGDAYHIDENDWFIESYPTEPWDMERLKETCYLCQPAVFFRRRIVERFGLLDEELNYCMDYEYWLRLAYGGATFAYFPKVLAGSRLYAETKTLGARVKVHEEINSMMLKLFGRVPDRWLFNYAHVVTEEWGMKRSNRWFFIPALIGISFYAAFRWNRSVSKSLLGSMWQWLVHALRQTFLRAPAV